MPSGVSQGLAESGSATSGAIGAAGYCTVAKSGIRLMVAPCRGSLAGRDPQENALPTSTAPRPTINARFGVERQPRRAGPLISRHASRTRVGHGGSDLPSPASPRHRGARAVRYGGAARPRGCRRGRVAADREEEGDAARAHADQPVLRALDAHPGIVRARRQAARRRRDEHVGGVLLREEGRDPDRHRGDA